MTFGVHPHYANDFDTEAYLALDRLLDRPQVVGLGEIGLDYSAKNNVDRTIQKRTFDNQLRLAMEKKLPVCLHIRDADVDALAVLDEAGLPLDYKIHLHCFTSSWEQCLVWLNKYPNLKVGLVLFYRKLSLSIIENFAIFGVIELSIFVAKIINNSR
jgi:TatD DNase family protein